MSPKEIENINNLLADIKSKPELDIFTTMQRVDFLNLGLYLFNQVPPFSNFSYKDSGFVNKYNKYIIDIALILAQIEKELVISNLINDNKYLAWKEKVSILKKEQSNV